MIRVIRDQQALKETPEPKVQQVPKARPGRPDRRGRMVQPQLLAAMEIGTLGTLTPENLPAERLAHKVLREQLGQQGRKARLEKKEQLERQAPKVQKGILEHAVPLGLLALKVQLALRAPQPKCRQPTRAAVLWSG